MLFSSLGNIPSIPEKKSRLQALNAPETTPRYELLQKIYDFSTVRSTLDWDYIGKRRRSSFLKNWYDFYKKFQ